MCTLQFFPSQFLGTVFGVCNVTARSITILSPMVAEADHPIPEVLIIATCLGAAILTRFLRTPNFMNKVDENKLEQDEKKRKKHRSVPSHKRDQNGSGREIELVLDFENKL